MAVKSVLVFSGAEDDESAVEVLLNPDNPKETIATIFIDAAAATTVTVTSKVTVDGVTITHVEETSSANATDSLNFIGIADSLTFTKNGMGTLKVILLYK